MNSVADGTQSKEVRDHLLAIFFPFQSQRKLNFFVLIFVSTILAHSLRLNQCYKIKIQPLVMSSIFPSREVAMLIFSRCLLVIINLYPTIYQYCCFLIWGEGLFIKHHLLISHYFKKCKFSSISFSCPTKHMGPFTFPSSQTLQGVSILTYLLFLVDGYIETIS